MLYGNCLFRGGFTPAGLIVMLSLCTFSLGAAPLQADTTAALKDSSNVASGDSSGAEEKENELEEEVVVINLEEGGRIIMELLSEDAPLAVERITELINKGFYDGLKFHRVESYLVQTGDKEHRYSPVTGEMFSQYLRHEKGMVGMARLADDYDSAATQFYICKKELPSLNGEYTLFARVIKGMELVHEIEEGDRIESVEFKKPE